MSLLNNVMDHSLDDGYAEAAARKQAADGGLPKTLRAKLGLAAGLVLAALVVTVGAAQARVEAPVVAKEREELIDRINEETAAADRLEDTVDELRDDVSARQREALKASGGNERGELVGVLAGAVEVHGPGVKLVVNDAKASGSGGEGDPRQSSGFSDTGRVRDRDMQRVVNGLWESGAEAISINGQRLTALSAIRAAGDAILVDNKPLVPPYTVLAVGDGEGLSRRFQASADGLYLDALKENFGIRTTLSVEGELKLPAAPSVTVRTAQPNTENTEKGTS
ncbi:membrane protein [Streptomyces sp. NBRC 14336]|nr:membrane protein [Streptomyces sp. NBRC 14336]